MNTSAFHLNLLKSSERVSSSPVRLRVMIPTLALLVVIGMALWAVIVFGQLLIVKKQAKTVDEENQAKKKSHVEVLERMSYVREIQLQLEQLEYYKTGVRAVGEPLAELAEIMPLKVQLTELSIPPPEPQVLQKPGTKIVLFGPVTNVETQKLVLAGRTTRETPVVAMMESLETPEFAKLITNEKNINSFKQDTVGKGGRQLLSFDIEYVMPGRRFEK